LDYLFPLDKLVIVPIENDGVIPFEPFDPEIKPKFKIGLLVVPVILTVGLLPLDKFVIFPIENDGLIPFVPLVPFDPETNPKFKTPDEFKATYGVPDGPKFVTVPTLKLPILSFLYYIYH
jgi:hypothetical protein